MSNAEAYPHADGPLDGYIIRYTEGGRLLQTFMSAEDLMTVLDRAAIMLRSLGPRHPQVRATIIEHRTIHTMTWADNIAAPEFERIDLND